VEGAPILLGASTRPTGVGSWMFVEVRFSIEARRDNMGEVLPEEK